MIVTAVLIVVVAIVAFFVGRNTAPEPPAPEPRRFGLNEAEALATKIGRLDQTTARVAEVAAVVGGMTVTVREDAESLSSHLTMRAESDEAEAASLRREAAEREGYATSDRARAAEVTALAATFGATS